MSKAGKDNWYERDEQAWNNAAKKLHNEGWTQEPNSAYQATFHKDDETVTLVRDLGKLNWHPENPDASLSEQMWGVSK